MHPKYPQEKVEAFRTSFCLASIFKVNCSIPCGWNWVAFQMANCKWICFEGWKLQRQRCGQPMGSCCVGGNVLLECRMPVRKIDLSWLHIDRVIGLPNISHMKGYNWYNPVYAQLSCFLCFWCFLISLWQDPSKLPCNLSFSSFELIKELQELQVWGGGNSNRQACRLAVACCRSLCLLKTWRA